MRWAERLDPEVRAVLDQVPRLDIADIPTARAERDRLAATAREAWVPSGRVLSEDRIVPGRAGGPEVRVRVHRPVEQDGDLPVLVWVHGGGHVLGTAAQDDPLLDELVSELGCVAVAVDWRRAPENPFPAALEDCYAAVAWVHGQAGLGLDPARLVVAGASSGGGLAAGLALLVRDRGEYAVTGQVLIYPMLDDRAETLSSRSVTDERVWNDRSNRLAWAAYLGAVGPEVPVYAAPSRAVDLAGLPWTWIASAELDLFVDENVEYAARLMQAGVSTELVVYRGAVHGFELFAPDAAVSRRFRRDRLEALRTALLA